MLDMLERGDADIAMTVSDAFIVANSKGRNVELVGTWVSSPLVWAVAASPLLPRDILTVPDLLKHRQTVTGNPHCKLRVGISRPGSGSQTMATYMAMLHRLDYVHGLEFVVANNFDGLKKGIETDEFDLFLWETFTTKPDFDSDVLRKLDDVRTPWPAFSLVMKHSSSVAVEEEEQRLRMAVAKGLFPALAESAHAFTADPEAATQRIVARFGHQETDARLWLHSVHYNVSSFVEANVDVNYADEQKGHATHFKSTPSYLTLQPIDVDLYSNSVRILQSVGLVSADFNVQSLWPSRSLFYPNDNIKIEEHVPIIPQAFSPQREIETL